MSLLAVLRVILRTLDELKCFRCLEKAILWSRLCLVEDEFLSLQIPSLACLILLSGMNDLRR